MSPMPLGDSSRRGVALAETGRAAATQFIGELQRLRLLAGAPSLIQLVAVTQRLARPLARSTLSDKLNVKSLPEWDFVVSFVTACKACAEAAGVTLPPDLTDLAGWDARHLTMLNAVEVEYAEQRLAAAARVELSRRSSRAMSSRQQSSAPADQPWSALPEEADRLRIVPRQLPPAGRHFIGRGAELAQLTGLLDAADINRTVVISTIEGTAGVGKTALAVYWAHQMVDRFPDGQLYVNLRGFDGTGAPVDPADAVRGFLDAFQVTPAQIPISLEGQAALYRSLVGGRRMVIILDDALSAEQVRPLLPGSSPCVVLVTSRSRLTSLMVKEGALPLSLDLLSAGEARELLASTLGPDRVVADLPSADDIIARCSWLPLALAIVAARAATNPRFPLAALERELRETRRCLDAFDGGDASTDLRAVFSWSHERLRDPAARLFRLLGLHPGPDISVAAAAGLIGTSVDQVRPLLAELARAHLVEERVPGRFTFHDLLRAYATELVSRHDTDDIRRTALRRVLDHYVHTARSADRLLNPHRDPIAVAAPHDGVLPERLTDRGAALSWFNTEHPVLLAAIGQAADAGFDSETWHLAWSLESYFDYCGHWHDWLATQHSALDAARRLDDPAMRARAHHDLARIGVRLGRYDDADAHLRMALDLFVELDDRPGQADTNLLMAIVFQGLGRHRKAISHLHQALRLFRAADHATGQAAALNRIGWNYALLDDQRKALAYCQHALDLQRELGNRHGEASTWDSLGYAHHRFGRYEQAASCFRRAHGLFATLGDRYHEADTINRLGDTHYAAGQTDAARDAWRRALAILERLDHTSAERVRVKLFPPLVVLPQVSTQM